MGWVSKMRLILDERNSDEPYESLLTVGSSMNRSGVGRCR